MRWSFLCAVCVALAAADRGPTNSAKIPINVIASSLTITGNVSGGNSTLNVPRKTFILQTWAVDTTPQRTQLFCVATMFCRDGVPLPGVTIDREVCARNESSTQNFKLINACRARVGVAPCARAQVDTACLVSTVTFGFENQNGSSFTLPGVTVAWSLTRPTDLAYRQADGTINLSLFDKINGDLSDASSFRTAMVESAGGLFSITLNTRTTGFFEFGKNLVDAPEPAVISSVSPVRTTKRLFNFMFGLSVCGVDLFSNYSSHWPFIVAIDRPCLAIPSVFFSALTTWLPVDCPSEAEALVCQTNTSHACAIPCAETTDDSTVAQDCFSCCRRCRLRQGADINAAPPLTFSLQENKGTVSVPVQSMLLDDNKTLCVEPLKPTKTGEYLEQARQLVLWGSVMTRQPLSLVVDYNTNRIGVVSRKSPLIANASCLAPVECIGDQEYYAPLNKCLDPECSRYFFQRVDPDTKKCKLTVVVQVTIWLGLAFLVCIEILGQETYRGFSRRIRNS